uniref:7TM_GPCR_Srx domain-containing protein n=1 Tax=Panagrellus redivivus TaxID=6233 RepID=A0A7E4UL29_PANRE
MVARAINHWFIQYVVVISLAGSAVSMTITSRDGWLVPRNVVPAFPASKCLPFLQGPTWASVSVRYLVYIGNMMST